MGGPLLTVVGLDSATFDVIDPLIEAGELPNLKRLFDSGTRGVLRSTTHPLTPLAWTTMVTGVNAGRHGIWDFSERDETGYHVHPINGSYRRVPALWDRLSAAGRRVGILNVPFTWPAPTVEGFVVAGLDASARERGMTHPPELVSELRERFGPLDLDHGFPLDADGQVDLDRVRRACEQRVAAAHWLSERFDPELLFVVFMSADHIHHLCWPEWEQDGAQSRVAEVYRILDQAVGDLLGPLDGSKDVLVVSDHGGGSLHGVLNINAWLAHEGYLAYTPERAIGGDQFGRRMLRNVSLGLRKYLPERLRYAIKQRAPGLREKVVELRDYSVIDWESTRAFSYGTFGNIVVNLRGREEHGIVEPGDEYERLRDELIAKALELRGPEGEQIVAAVHRREDLYDGPAVGVIPDLIVEFAEYAWLGKGSLRTRSTELWDTIPVGPDGTGAYVGSHRHEGIVALSGPSAADAPDFSASIEDIAPTVLYLLGEPIPSDTEGRVLFESIDPELVDRRPPEYADAETVEVGAERRYDEGEGEVEDRLRALGYLE